MPTGKTKRKSRRRRPTRTVRRFTPPQAGADFQKLVTVMSRLRAPKGCPWDREQTHATLRTYLIEEAYEVLDALDSNDNAKFAEELGDLLLQILFHAQIAHEEKRFDVRDVIREIYEKMIRRHPHVFGTTRAKNAAEVLRNWEQIKLQERQSKSPKPSLAASEATDGHESVLAGVPRTLPALLEALQLTRKAARIGFDWPDIDGIFAKLTEETHELQAVMARPLAEAPASPSTSTIESEVGDILFVAVNLARFVHVDPEIALKKTSAKFTRRFRTMERLAREQGTTLPKVPRPQMENLWEEAKRLEQSPKQTGTL